MSDRRTFLKVLGGAAALGAGGCGSTITEDGAGGMIQGGPAKDVPEGSLTAQSQAAVALGRDASGLYAVTTICTHQGCDIRSSGTIDAAGLACGCHGSRFDSNGGVVNGPAARPLDHYGVLIDDAGNWVIDTGTVVSAEKRTPAT